MIHNICHFNFVKQQTESMKFPVSFFFENTITGHCYTMHTLRRHTSLGKNHHKLRNQRLASFFHRPKVKTSGKDYREYPYSAKMAALVPVIMGRWHVSFSDKVTPSGGW